MSDTQELQILEIIEEFIDINIIHPEYLQESVYTECSRCYLSDIFSRYKKGNDYFCVFCNPVVLFTNKNNQECPLSHKLTKILNLNLILCESCCRKLITPEYYFDEQCNLYICIGCLNLK